MEKEKEMSKINKKIEAQKEKLLKNINKANDEIKRLEFVREQIKVPVLEATSPPAKKTNKK